MAETHAEGASGDSNTASHSLFQGKQFWLSQNIPQRSRFKELIQQNGGVIKLFEKDAEIKLVDHVRKNLPANSFSYQFIEDSVRNRRLESLEKYRAGASSPRPVGATNIASRGHRILYTLQDDQFLWDWMQPYEKENMHISGNKIYQELALVNPRHTYQSYRDRYLKRLRGRPRPGGMPQSTAPLATQESNQTPQTPTPIAPARAAPAVASSSQQRSKQGPSTTIQTPEFRKRKRSPSIHSSDDTDSTGGDIPPRKRRATQSPESEQAPERPLQSREAPSEPEPKAPRSPRVVIPAFDVEIVSKRSAEKPKAPNNEPQNVPKKIPEKAPEKAPERAPERAPKQAPEQLLEQDNKQKPRSPSPAQGVYEPEPIDPIFLELPFLPSSPGSTNPESEEQPEHDIDVWIDHRLQTGIAKNEDQIVEALRCTSMNPQLADQVLKRLVVGEGIPKDIAGVWTAEDDKCIEGRDSRDIERVLEKHGPDFFNSRWQYLDMARTAGLEKGQEGEVTEL